MTEDKQKGAFLIVNIAAQRARQLMQGASPLIQTHSRKPAAIAIREVEKELVPFYMPENAPQPAEENAAETEDIES